MRILPRNGRNRWTRRWSSLRGEGPRSVRPASATLSARGYSWIGPTARDLKLKVSRRLHYQMCAGRGRVRFNVVNYRHLSRTVSKCSTPSGGLHFNFARKLPAVNDFRQSFGPLNIWQPPCPIRIRLQKYRLHFSERKVFTNLCGIKLFCRSSPHRSSRWRPRLRNNAPKLACKAPGSTRRIQTDKESASKPPTLEVFWLGIATISTAGWRRKPPTDLSVIHKRSRHRWHFRGYKPTSIRRLADWSSACPVPLVSV